MNFPAKASTMSGKQNQWTLGFCGFLLLIHHMGTAGIKYVALLRVNTVCLKSWQQHLEFRKSTARSKNTYLPLRIIASHVCVHAPIRALKKMRAKKICQCPGSSSWILIHSSIGQAASDEFPILPQRLRGEIPPAELGTAFFFSRRSTPWICPASTGKVGWMGFKISDSPSALKTFGRMTWKNVKMERASRA